MFYFFEGAKKHANGSQPFQAPEPSMIQPEQVEVAEKILGRFPMESSTWEYKDRARLSHDQRSGGGWGVGVRFDRLLFTFRGVGWGGGVTSKQGTL